MKNHIHLVNTHGIGDVIMSLPTINSILSSGIKLSMTVKSKVEASVINSALGLNGEIEFIFFKDYSNKGIKGYFGFFRKLRNFNVDIIIPSISVGKTKYNLMALLSKAKIRTGLSGGGLDFNHVKLSLDERRHKVEVNYEIFRGIVKKLSLDINLDKDVTMPIFSGKKDCNVNVGQLVAIAPGCGILEKHKRWPLEKYAELANQLLKKNFSIAILGGNAEKELAEEIVNLIHDNKNVYNFVGKLSIESTLSTLYNSEVLVANCNGVSHMASLIRNIDIVGLYGPTDYKFTGPYSDNLHALTLGLDCSPCYSASNLTGCGNPVCMKNIDVVSVENIVSNICSRK
ncbi:glycosyltransferase family 9 protein [Vibrio splendidus]